MCVAFLSVLFNKHFNCCPSGILFTKNPTCSTPVMNLFSRCERPSTTRLGHGSAWQVVMSVKLIVPTFLFATFIRQCGQLCNVSERKHKHHGSLSLCTDAAKTLHAASCHTSRLHGSRSSSKYVGAPGAPSKRYYLNFFALRKGWRTFFESICPKCG